MARSGWRGHEGDGYSCAMSTDIGENKAAAPSLMHNLQEPSAVEKGAMSEQIDVGYKSGLVS
jgi:hypothetical protein